MIFSYHSFSASIRQESLGDSTSLQSPQVPYLALSFTLSSEDQYKGITLSSFGKAFSQTLLGSGVDNQPTKGNMSDPEDSGPLTQRAKRRFSRAAMQLDRETIVIDGDSDGPQPAASTLNVKDGVDAMITKLRTDFIAETRETQNEVSSRGLL
jgi:hypothetical protein